MRVVLLLALGLAGLVWSSAPARADVIDGAWCYKDGQSLEIHGPDIRIPSGQRLKGRYTRHSFVYEPPPGDADQGAVIVMRIFSDDDMELTRVRNGQNGPAELWHRCNVTS